MKYLILAMVILISCESPTEYKKHKTNLRQVGERILSEYINNLWR